MDQAQIQALVLTFVVTTVLGGFVGALFQRMAWKRQARLDQARASYAELTDVFEKITLLIDARYYGMFKWQQALAEGLPDEEVQRRIDAYFVIVADWNSRIRLFHNQLRIHFGDDRALAFLDYADDFDIDTAVSLHYRFVRVTRRLSQATKDRTQLAAATEDMHHLNWALAAFAKGTADELVSRASQLRRLRFETAAKTNEGGMLVSGPQHPGLPRNTPDSAIARR
ncbi:hypothetical protein [Agromyces sp. SYSU T00194]|uniref:hypothetical protein n=1 Tax=Agromyces chitinivorans TaxID=3158560 RepID=UPI00339ACAAA